MSYYRFIIHNDSSEEIDLKNGTLYLPENLRFINGVAVIRKGTSLKGIFGLIENSLRHYGRSKADGAPGVGTGNWRRHGSSYHKNDIIKKKNFLNSNWYYRISSNKEKEVRKGEYITDDVDDHNEYLWYYQHGELDNSDKKQEPYRIYLKAKKDIHIRSGRDTVKDAIKNINKKEVTEAFNKLDDLGFFDTEKTKNQRIQSLYVGGLGTKENYDALKTLRKEIHEYVYSDKNKFYDKYSKAGYEAVIDPEDYASGVHSPIIIIDPEAFDIKWVTKAKKEIPQSMKGYY